MDKLTAEDFQPGDRVECTATIGKGLSHIPTVSVGTPGTVTPFAPPSMGPAYVPVDFDTGASFHVLPRALTKTTKRHE